MIVSIAEFSIRVLPFFEPRQKIRQIVANVYIKVKGECKYLYRAIDSQGNTLDFMRLCQKKLRSGQEIFQESPQKQA